MTSGFAGIPWDPRFQNCTGSWLSFGYYGLTSLWIGQGQGFSRLRWGLHGRSPRSGLSRVQQVVAALRGVARKAQHRLSPGAYPSRPTHFKLRSNLAPCGPEVDKLFNRFAHSAGPGTETLHSELDSASSTQRVGCSESLRWMGRVPSGRGRDQRPGA